MWCALKHDRIFIFILSLDFHDFIKFLSEIKILFFDRIQEALKHGNNYMKELYGEAMEKSFIR